MTLAASRPAIKAKALLRWPAAILQGAGISVTRANGNITFALNFPALADNTGVSDPSQYTTAVYNRTSGGYEELRLDYLPVPTEAATRTPRGDANYSILNTDRYVALTATLTAPRTWTLPAANAVPAGRLLGVQDEAGGLSGTNTITLTPSGSDTINGAASYVLATARGGVELRSDGTSKWSVRALADASVTNAKLAQMPATTVKANPTGAAAAPSDLTFAALFPALLPAAQVKTAGWTVTAADLCRRFIYTGAADASVPLPAGASVGAPFSFPLRHAGASGILTLVPNGSDAIDVATVLAGEDCEVAWDGAQWRVFGLQSRTLITPTMQVSAVSTAVLSVPTGYSAFELDVQDFKPSVTAGGALRVSFDGGTTYLASTASYAYSNIFMNGASTVAGAAGATSNYYPLSGNILVDSRVTLNTQVKINPGTSTTWPFFQNTDATYDAAYGAAVATIGGYAGTTGRITNLQFVATSGTISLKYRLWGIR